MVSEACNELQGGILITTPSGENNHQGTMPLRLEQLENTRVAVEPVTTAALVTLGVDAESGM